MKCIERHLLGILRYQFVETYKSTTGDAHHNLLHIYVPQARSQASYRVLQPQKYPQSLWHHARVLFLCLSMSRRLNPHAVSYVTLEPPSQRSPPINLQPTNYCNIRTANLRRQQLTRLLAPRPVVETKLQKSKHTFPRGRPNTRRTLRHDSQSICDKEQSIFDCLDGFGFLSCANTRSACLPNPFD